MSTIAIIPFGLSFLGFEFGPLETILLVAAIATAMVSLVELIHLSTRDRFVRRVATLRGTTVTRAELVGSTRVPWYDRVGAILAKSPMVGVSEQRRLATKLARAGVGGPRQVATFIAIRFLCALLGVGAAWLSLGFVDLPAKAESFRYLIVAFGLVPGWRLPDIVLDVMAGRRKLRLETGFPDALDLLVICAEAGLGLEQAIAQVAHDMRFATPDVAAEFATTAAEMRILADRRLPLEHLAERTGLESLQGMISILNQSIKFGTPLSESLRQLTAEARMVRIARMEERGARLSVTLLLPVMVFILPSMFLVIGGPIGLKAAGSFSAVFSAAMSAP